MLFKSPVAVILANATKTLLLTISLCSVARPHVINIHSSDWSRGWWWASQWIPINISSIFISGVFLCWCLDSLFCPLSPMVVRVKRDYDDNVAAWRPCHQSSHIQGPPLYSTVMSFMMAMINCRRLLLLLFSAWMTRRRALIFIQLAKFIPRVNINICAHKQHRKSPYTPPWVWVWSTALAKAQIKHIVSIVGGGRVGDEFELILASTVTQGFL